MSDPYIPNPLRPGSTGPTPPSSRQTSYHARPRPSPRSDSSSSRVSELFDSRRSSLAATFDSSNDPPSRFSRRDSDNRFISRRDSSPIQISPISETAPSPSLPASLRPNSYARHSTFSPPALPALNENTEYSRLAGQPSTNFAIDDARPAVPPARKKSVFGSLGRFGTITSRGKLAGRNRYDQLPDVEDAYGIDLSMFEGSPAVQLNVVRGGAGAAAVGTDGSHRGMLGEGMDHVLTATVANSTPTTGQKQPGLRRHGSVVDDQVRYAAIQTATKANGIVALDTPAVDISNLGGGSYERLRKKNLIETGGAGRKQEKSYFFPEDPQKPSWKPWTMRWPYITMLVVLALLLAALQEYFRRMSLNFQKRGKGLLEFDTPAHLDLGYFFLWKYMPTIVLVTYGVLWQNADFEIKRLEAFYQLSKRSGATARDSLNLDYLTTISYLIPIFALRSKQWAVFLSSMATLITSGLIPILQSASLQTLHPKPAGDEREDKRYVVMQSIWSFATSGSLILVALLGICLLVQLRRKSGLQSDPKGIAGIASMATKSHILNDFKGLDRAPNHLIHTQLRSRRYTLYKSSLWQGEYIRSADKITPSTTTTTTTTNSVENTHPIMLRLPAGIAYVAYLVLLAILIPIFIKVRAVSAVTEKVPFLLTALATIVKLLWATLDMSVRVMEPYFWLSRGGAPPRTLTLDYTGTTVGWLSVKAALNGHWLVMFVSIGALLSEGLTVAVTSFNAADDDFDFGSSEETFKSFWISFGLSMFILCYLTMVAAAVYAKRRHNFLPRQPGSIASVLAYIHQSRMLEDFVDTESFNSREMTRHLEKKGKTYALGWFNGRDNEDHCGVDYEPIEALYKPGEDWSRTHIRTHQDWTMYEA